MSKSIHKIGAILILFLTFQTSFGQVKIGDEDPFLYPKKYKIAGITVSGVKHYDTQAIILFSGLKIGEEITIPGDDISGAIKKIWKQRLFANIKIHAADVRGNDVYLNLELEERPRLAKFRFLGVRKSEAEALRDKVDLISGAVVTEDIINRTHNKVQSYFANKGFLNTEINIKQIQDTVSGATITLDIDIKKGDRVKIESIDFPGLTVMKAEKARRQLKETKEKRIWRIFSQSKFSEENFEADQEGLISKFNELGYRNARITEAEIDTTADKNLAIKIHMHEGDPFYFRNVRFVGNTKYTSEELTKILGIKKGDIYNKKTLDSRLYMNPNGGDVSSLYLDDGYLSFSPTVYENAVGNDSIDLEVRIREGRQSRINEIKIFGNTRTRDHVIIREIKTRPGQLFSRSDIIRTQSQLSQLGYFNPEKFNVNPVPNQADGTVDLEYTVEERASDQIELSGGWGAGTVVGTIGVSLNNFSMRRLLGKDTWPPLGDGQRISLRAQSNGTFYQGYNMSFTEPWLGGKKPNSFSVSLSHSVQTNGEPKRIENSEGEKVTNPDRAYLKISGISFGLGKRLQVPDDYFQLFQSIGYQRYDIHNYGAVFSFSEGFANVASYTFNLTRSSISQPIYPRFGSQLSLTLKATPPLSLLNNKDYSELPEADKFKWVEYHKWKFTASWFTELAKDLVLNTRMGYGFLGKYNSDIGPSPFERFYLGGSALSGFSIDGREIIGLRGYDDLSLSPQNGALLISKYTAEVRYPLSLNPSATIYGMAFAEAGRSWNERKNFNPFNLKRSAGVGIRIFMPMFGLMGLDYGWRLDDVQGFPNMARGQFHFTIGMNLGEL